MSVRWPVALEGIAVVLIAILYAPGFAAAQGTQDAPSELPEAIPIFPLPDVTLFPNSTQPFHIFEPRYRAMVADALAGDSIIGMVTLRPGFESDYEGRPPVYEMGCAGVIVSSEQMPDGRYNIVLRAIGKFRVLSEDTSLSYRLARVEQVPEAEVADGALLSRRRTQLEDAVLSAFPNATRPSPDVADAQVIDGFSLVVPLDPVERMELLEADGPAERALRLVRRLRGGPRSSL